MVRRFLLAAVLICAAAPAQADRLFRLNDRAALPVVSVLVDDYGTTARYRRGTGVLVGRCDVMLTARHVVRGADPSTIHVHSPQIRGRSTLVIADGQAASLRNAPPSRRAEDSFDDDVVVLRLKDCPTHHRVPLDALVPISFSHIDALVVIGFPCDSGGRRAPERIDFRGSLVAAPIRGSLSRRLRLTPGARPGQSGAPVFSVSETGTLALHMLLVATVRHETAPVGCGIDAQTGQSDAGQAAFGVLLTADFIDAFGAYVSALYEKEAR